jgi:hypothetical protein
MRESKPYQLTIEHSSSRSANNRNENRSEPARITIPAQLKAFSEISCLLPGENQADFETIRQMMIDDIQPENNLEWLWLLDLAELSWEILRYRQLKQRIIEAYRERAIEAILLRLDGAGMSTKHSKTLQSHIRKNAVDWRDDPEAAAEIEARLVRYKFNGQAVNAEVYCQAHEAFTLFNDLMRSAQNRRLALLREISFRREFAKRVERLREASLDARNARNRRGRI